MTLDQLTRIAVAFIRRRLWIVRVDGPSMRPTYQSGDLIFCEVGVRPESLRAGDVVVLGSGEVTAPLNVKRFVRHLDQPERSSDDLASCIITRDNSQTPSRVGDEWVIPERLIVARAIAPRALRTTGE